MPSCRLTNVICARSLRQTDTLTTVLGKQKLYKTGQSRLMPCSKFLFQGHFGKQRPVSRPLNPPNKKRHYMYRFVTEGRGKFSFVLAQSIHLSPPTSFTKSSVTPPTSVSFLTSSYQDFVAPSPEPQAMGWRDLQYVIQADNCHFTPLENEVFLFQKY